ncbi:MAG: TIM barrel protein [Bacteroidota bacterium]
MKRRTFISSASLGALALATHPSLAVSPPPKALKISLAQWSLHREIGKGRTNPLNFARTAMEKYRIEAIEYVNQFYTEHATDETFWQEMKRKADDVGVKSLLIMVDDEGELGHKNEKKRNRAVENHYKWVHAAKLMDCHSIRVNAFGAKKEAEFRASLVEGMGRLAGYAAKENINVIIENHGLYSSNAELIAEIIEEVDMPNFGSFPDFGNWCMSAKWGSTQIQCEEAYDLYEGVSTLLPYAKAVSAKSYNFEKDGSHPQIDYQRMLQIVKDSSYDGYIGIEYEGSSRSEHEGILATKKLMEQVWKELA